MKSLVNTFISNLIDRASGKQVSVSDLADLVAAGGGGDGGGAVTSVNGQTGAVELDLSGLPEAPSSDGRYTLQVDGDSLRWDQEPE
jgi:hypothetical protein